MLGAGDAGKSTVMKQMKILHVQVRSITKIRIVHIKPKYTIYRVVKRVKTKTNVYF